MGLEMANSPCSSGKMKFEKDPIRDPFKLKCRQAFNGPQDFEVAGFLEFKYNEFTMRGSMTFRYNHIVDNLKQELSIAFPYVESFTLVEPKLLEGVCGALIVVLTERCVSKMIPSFGSREFIAERMKNEQDCSSSLMRFLFVLEPMLDLENFFQGNSEDETPKLFPFRELENRFDWVVKTRSLDTKRGIHNANINVFEKCTAEGFAKYLQRNLLRIVPYDITVGANYAYHPHLKKICLHPKDEFNKKQKREKHNTGEMQNGAYDENVFYELSDNLRNDFMQNDFKRKVAFYKKHVGFEDPSTNENIMDNIKASVTPNVKTHGNDCQKLSQGSCSSSQTTPSTSDNNRKSTRRKILTISLSDDEDGEDEKSSSSNCSLEPPEKKLKFTGHTSLLRFPCDGSNFVEVQFDDVRVLAHGEMLNDTIVEFYIRYVVQRLLTKADRDQIHVFNTFFFQKLTDRQPAHVFGKSDRSAALRFNWIKNNYKQVKSWTKKANIFEKDYIIVPVNDDLHWYVVIIMRPALAVGSTEGTSDSRKRGASCPNPATHILVLDSLKDNADTKRRCILDIVRDYLECELEDKKTIPGFFNRKLIGVVHPDGLPRQQNYVDCGLYLLGFVEAFMTRPPPIDDVGIPYLDWYTWFPHFNVKMKFMRDKILRFILRLAGPEKVEQLKAYELSQGRGATVPTLEAIVDEGRKPRRHSITANFETIRHSSFHTRCPSEPPDLKNYPPPAGITVSKT